MSTSSSGPLQGYRVIDVSIAFAGPIATCILADQGADVVKVERPDGGDFMRSVGTVHAGVSAVFAAANRNKRGVCIDLKDPRGRDVLRRLVATADVFVHNFRPGVAARLGIDEADLRPLRPDLVYVAITGWGEDGPYAPLAAYDSVMQAASGFAAHQADPVTGVPVFIHNTVCDKGTGLTAAQLITAALLARERTGAGQRVHVSMLHASLAFLWPDGMQNVTFLDGVDQGGAKATSPPVRRTTDGYVAISTMLDTEFRALCRVLGADELAADPRYTHAGERSRNSASLWAQIDPMLATWPTTTLVEQLAIAGVPHAIVRHIADIHEDPQIRATGLLLEVEHPDAGRMRVPRPVGDFTTTPLDAPGTAPRLGEHTTEVLTDAGIGGPELDRLRAAGVIA